jgi:tetratricopeptide (TPR) repeat protein
MAKSRKPEIKDDILTKVAKKTEQFIRKYLKIILLSVLVIAVLAAGYFTIDHLMNRNEEAAEQLFSKVYLAYSNAMTEQGGDEDQLKDTLMALNEDFREVMVQYPKSSAASRSAYYIGNTLFRYEAYEEALENYGKGAQIKPQSYSALLCVQGEASCFEQLGDYERASERYSHILEKYGDSFLVPMVKFSLGQIYEEQEQYDKAREQYDSIVTDHSWSSWAELAEKKVLLLKNKGSDDEV